MNSRSGDNNRWICPNDRVLTFRAKLDAGWSVRSTANTAGNALSATPSPSISPYHSVSNLSISPSPSYSDVNSVLGINNSNTGCGNQVTSNITEEEQEKIMRVLSRARAAEQVEKDRIQRLTERLKNMERNSGGNGKDKCALCGEKLPFFSLTASSFECHQCSKFVCSKCVVDQICPNNGTLYYCKICSETREVWKKSGAWFLKNLPTFPLLGTNNQTTVPSSRSPSTSSTKSFFWSTNRFGSPPSPTDSLNSVATITSLAVPTRRSASPPHASKTRSCLPPSSLSVSGTAKPKPSFHFNHRSRMM